MGGGKRKKEWSGWQDRGGSEGCVWGCGAAERAAEERKKQAIARLGTAGQDSHHKANQAFFFSLIQSADFFFHSLQRDSHLGQDRGQGKGKMERKKGKRKGKWKLPEDDADAKIESKCSELL